MFQGYILYYGAIHKIIEDNKISLHFSCDTYSLHLLTLQ